MDDEFISSPSKPTKKVSTASRHPAKTRTPVRPAIDGEDGFTGNVYEQRKKLWDERE